jgi:hypothetical protein
MHKTVATTTELMRTWDSRINFLMADQCVPFSFEFPPTQQIVERLVAEQKPTGITRLFTHDLAVDRLFGRDCPLKTAGFSILFCYQQEIDS